jgi:hypothetical protein
VLSYDKPTLYSGLSVNRMIADINKLDQKARRAGFRSYNINRLDGSSPALRHRA